MKYSKKGGDMNFHSTTNSRIREISSTRTVEHRATLHYSNTNYDVGVNGTVVVDKV